MIVIVVLVPPLLLINLLPVIGYANTLWDLLENVEGSTMRLNVRDNRVTREVLITTCITNC